MGNPVDSGHKLFKINQIKNTQRLFINLSYDFFEREVKISSKNFLFTS